MSQSSIAGRALALAAALSLAAGAGVALAESRISLVSARDLADRTLYDQAGTEFGAIDYVLVGLDGRVTGVAVKPAAETAEKMDALVIVPWDALSVAVVGEAVAVATPATRIASAPRLTHETLADVTQPKLWTRVTEYWAPLIPPGMGDETAQATRRAPTQQARNAAAAAEKGEKAPQTAKAGETGAGESVAMAGQSAAEAGAAGADTEPQLVVGRRVVTTLSDPGFRFAEQLRGSPVLDEQGGELGELDEIVIDTERGRVAYAVVASGSFLDRSWYAVPFEALEWTAGDPPHLRLQSAQAKLAEIESLDASRTPMSVKRSELAQLHERFGLAPYWQDVAGGPPAGTP